MLYNLLQRLLPNRKVTYDDQFFKISWFAEWELLKCVLQQLVNEISPNQHILDFGCGPGIMIDHMNDAGFHYVGCDYSSEARQLYNNKYGKYPERYVDSLESIANHTFDLLLSFDVFEHMTDDQIDSIITATKNIPLLFLNISRDRRTPGHINIKNDSNWICFFEKRRLTFDSKLTGQLRNRYKAIRQGCPDHWDKNMFVFRRNKVTQ